jgi:quercetin dioxygenase-like cupin family protein
MTEEVRRVVTGHNVQGHAVVKAIDVVPLVTRSIPNWQGAELWATSNMPTDNDALDVVPINAGAMGGRSVLRQMCILPGGSTGMHRTLTLDYVIILSGQLDMELDSGDIVKLGPSDIVIQRGTNHRWTNSSDEPCRCAFVQFDAKPVTVGTTVLGEYLDEMPAGMSVMYSSPK